MKRLLYIVIAVAALGCTYSESSDFGNIDPKGWAYGDTLAFDVQPAAVDGQVTDTSAVRHCDLSLVVRHNNRYLYSNIWLELNYMGPDSILTDTVNMQLADEFGNWIGKGLGMSFQCEQPVLQGIDIDVSQPVRVCHIMRCDTLQDIEQVGVVVTNNK